MINITHSLLIVAIISLVTILIRFLPFIIFPDGKETPKLIAYISKVLPYAIIGMLVIYCLKSVSILAFPHGLPELISIILVIGIHVWKRNSLLSISIGTICYMLLVQVVFV